MIVFTKVWLCVLLAIVTPSVLSHRRPADDLIPPHDKCQRLTVSLCDKMPYNTTILPNLLGHNNQDDINHEIISFAPLIKVNCSPDLHFFLCTIYVPVCTILENPLPPCRSLCLSAKNNCEDLMKNFGYTWPETFNCDQFPDINTSLCVGQNNASLTHTSTTYDEDEEQKRQHKRPKQNTTFARDIGFVCPRQFQIKNPDYSIKVGKKVEKNCGAPCNMMFFNESKRRIARVWIGTWAILCSASCLFTVCTFLIDTDRFRYPERPIIFLSVCYLMVALAYVIGFLAGDTIACKRHQPSDDGVMKVATITQGTKYELCTIVFMVLYFFSMASSIWWVVLTLTWFLAAGLKWGHEAIEANSQYFHLAAWAVPAIKTITILAMGKVDGDVLSGVCYVGLWNIESMRLFVLTPLCAYLVFGTIFLTSGFVSLFRIRTVMKHDGTKTDKLEKLMIRIGVFSVLYTVPAIIVIACLFYEHFEFDSWMWTWSYDMCMKQIYAVPCPRIIKTMIRPHFEIFMLKYLMYMIVGITSSVWIWSGKTVHSWKMFFGRFRKRNTEAYV